MTTLLIILSIAAIIVLTWCSETGDLFWTIMAAIALCLVVGLEKDISFKDVGSYIQKNTTAIALSALAYVLVGIFWGLLKWRWYCSNHYKKRTYMIHATDEKARIIGWMLWWPVSASWFLIHDPVTKLYNFIYRSLVRTFDDISDKQRIKHKR